MVAKLRAVKPGEKAVKAEPKSLVEAAGMGRMDFLVKARKTIAQEIDNGVPAHSLARLISELDGLDQAIRKIEAADDAEAKEAADAADTADEAFDSQAI